MKGRKTLLFLHGYLSSSKSFYYQQKFFERDFNVYIPDLKGFGENVGMDYPYSLSDYLQEVREYMYKFGINTPNVVAHSFGARIVIKGASEDSELFNKLVLTGAAGLRAKPSLRKTAKKFAFNVAKRFCKKEKLKRFYSSDYQTLSPVMQKSFIKIVNENLDERLKYIDNPTLLVFGEKDKETPLYMAKRFNSEIKNSTLTVIKGAGHFCFIDSPIKFNGEVREFLLSK